MGTKLIASKMMDDLIETAMVNPQAKPTYLTIDRLLDAAVQEQVVMTFLFMKIFPLSEILSTCTPRRIKKISKTLLTILLEKTPADVYVDTSDFNEYFLLLPGVSKEEAVRAGKQVHQIFQGYAEELVQEEGINPGIQGCVISFPDEAQTRFDLFRRAREALFYAAQTGEHCIVNAIPDAYEPFSTTLTSYHAERLRLLAKNDGIKEESLLLEAVDDLLLKYRHIHLTR